MKQHRSIRMLSGLLLGAAITGMVLTCGQKREADKTAGGNMVVVFAFGDAKVIRAGKEIPAKVGMLVNQDDEIKTTNGSVDLQTRNGSAIRVREFTTIQVARLTGGDSAETKISMKHGGLLASVKRKSSNENFAVVTPTAIAGVRGTTFSVEMDEEGSAPRVKVLDGKVAMAPRIQALEKYDSKQIESNAALKELAAIQQKNEVVLEEKTEGTISAASQQKVTALNAAIESAEAQNKPISEVAAVTAIKTEMTAGAATAVVKSEAVVTAKEEADAATLVSVDIEKVTETAGGASAEAQQSALEAMQKEREQKQEVVLQKIQDEASKKDLKSEQEIQKVYNKLEVVIMADGTRHTGAVIAQTGETLVVHTPEGVKRLPKGAVAAIEFY